MNENYLKKLVYTALFTALVFVATFSIRVPVPMTNGYIHIGDCMVLLSGLVLGPFFGAFAGGVGSALCDLLGGYTLWVGPTLIIKALMAFSVGYLTLKSKNIVRINISFGIGIAIMLAGYYLAYGIMTGNFIAPLYSIPANAIQGVSGIILANVLQPIIMKIMQQRSYKQQQSDI